MSFWWSRRVPPPSPECVHVASTSTYYILNYIGYFVNPQFNIYLSVLYLSHFNITEIGEKLIDITIQLFKRTVIINNIICHPGFNAHT